MKAQIIWLIEHAILMQDVPIAIFKLSLEMMFIGMSNYIFYNINHFEEVFTQASMNKMYEYFLQ